MSANGQSRVLVLEDDPDLATAMELLLEGEGCDVVTTASGKDAVLLAAREQFDLAIADLQVEDLSGQAVWQVLGDLARVPVLAMSASHAPWQEEAFHTGVSACLPKPFDVDTLMGLVSSLAGRTATHPDGPSDVEELSHEDLARIGALSEEELDRLPFGLIRLDRDRIIVGFNAYESNASGLAREHVVGRRFQDIAPCSKAKKFADCLDHAVQRPDQEHVLRFRFPRRNAVALVSVRAFFDAQRDQLWIFVSQRYGNGAA